MINYFFWQFCFKDKVYKVQGKRRKSIFKTTAEAVFQVEALF